MALATATRAAKFLVHVFSDMTNSSVNESVTIHGDNQGTIALATNSVHHLRSKHIDIKYHFFRLEVQRIMIHHQYIPTSEDYDASPIHPYIRGL